MNTLFKQKYPTICLLAAGALMFNSLAIANDSTWSIVPYAGFSVLDDQSATISGTGPIANGNFNVDVGSGFVAGISARYNYKNSPWISEFGWEYRSNDSAATPSSGELFDSGNYASNTFYINGRYAFNNSGRLTPWLGGGGVWTQEIDVDTENANAGISFADSGSVGFQLMVGADYDINERLYLSSEIRYSSQSGLSLSTEDNAMQVNDLNYQPVTFSIGLGIRF